MLLHTKMRSNCHAVGGSNAIAVHVAKVSTGKTCSVLTAATDHNMICNQDSSCSVLCSSICLGCFETLARKAGLVLLSVEMHTSCYFDVQKPLERTL